MEKIYLSMENKIIISEMAQIRNLDLKSWEVYISSVERIESNIYGLNIDT